MHTATAYLDPFVRPPTAEQRRNRRGAGMFFLGAVLFLLVVAALA